MPSIRQSIRSSTASKRPTSAIADGQIALNTASSTPGIFFKDNANNIIKAGPAHYGATAPNSSPATGGSAGNSIGEAWLDSSLTPPGWKIWDGSAWVNATPLSSDTVQGLVELATSAETQAGSDTARAVTSSGLQSKLSDSTSATSSTTIASSTAVKAAYDLAAAALPKSGGIITGNLEIGNTGSLTFEGATADAFETTLAVVDPTADRTITFPDTTGTVVTTGDSGTVTSTMILDGTILNADINASAAIVDTKLATIATAGKVSNSATTAASANTASAIVARDASGNFTAGTITAALTGAASSNVLKAGDTMTGVLAVTAGTAALPGIAVSGDPNTGIYSPGADTLALVTGGTNRIHVTSAGLVGIGTTGPAANLDVRGTGSASVEILRVGNGTKFLGLGTEGTNYSWIQSFAATPLYINPLGNNTILNSGGGNVGIGTTSASSLLTLRSTAADNTAGISMQGASAGNITNLYNTLTDFVVQHAASEAFRVDASRRLLVGTSSARTNVYYTTVATTPSVQFESAGSTYNGLSLINYSASGYSPVLTLGLSASNTQGTNTAVSNSFDLGAINFTGNDGTNFRTGASIVATNDQASAWAVGDCPTRLVFSTTADGPGNTPTERMRITNDGNVTISSTAYTSARLGIGGYANGDRLGVYMRASTDPATPFDFRNAANTTVGSIATTASATAFNTSSDYRLKENVTPITNGITRFQQLKPSQFNFIADPGHTVDGFLAHEAQAVVPECVTGTKDAVDADGKPVYQGIDQSKLVPLLTAALQEAIAKIEALEADVAALKGA